MRAVEQVLKKYQQAALLIGNGPNLFAEIMPSWRELLVSAGDKRIRFPYADLSNTEVYDLVQLYAKPATDVKNRVKKKLALKKSYDLGVHRHLMELALARNIPVLTTNFDSAFEVSIGAKIHHIESAGFTRHYPWKSYYALDSISLPGDGFGIWKVHGDVRYEDSIRLGLTDYIGSAQRARKLISSGEGRLGNNNRKAAWQGHKTWLDIWFHHPIVIIGLGYGIDEVFLRWLLIERRRHFNELKKPMDVCYIEVGTPKPAVNNLMKNLGVTVKSVKKYADIYG